MIVSALDHLFGDRRPGDPPTKPPGPAPDGGVQRALDLARDGDRVYLPGVRTAKAPDPDVGTAYLAPAGGWQVRKSLTLFGDGTGSPGTYAGTTLVPQSGASNGHVVVIAPAGARLDHAYLRGFKITKRRTAPESDGADGVRLPSTTTVIGALRLDRIRVLHMNHNGLDLDPAPTAIERLVLLDFTTTFCGNAGVHIRDVRQALAVGSAVTSNLLGGWVAERSAVSFIVATFENNGTEGSPPHGQLLAKACVVLEADACHFELFSLGKKEALACEGAGTPDGPVWVAGCVFLSGSPAGAGTSVRVASTVSGPVAVLPNLHQRVTKLLDAAAQSAGTTVLAQFMDTLGVPINGEKGQIVLAPPPNGGSIASPTMSRIGTFPTDFAGLITPSFATEPTGGSVLQDGMLYYDTDNNHFRVRIGGAWRKVRTA